MFINVEKRQKPEGTFFKIYVLIYLDSLTDYEQKLVKTSNLKMTSQNILSIPFVELPNLDWVKTHSGINIGLKGLNVPKIRLFEPLSTLRFYLHIMLYLYGSLNVVIVCITEVRWVLQTISVASKDKSMHRYCFSDPVHHISLFFVISPLVFFTEQLSARFK